MPMLDLLLYIACALCNLMVRVGSYVFLRWIPSRAFPDSIPTAFVVYVASFLALYFKQSRYEVVARSSQMKLIVPPEVTIAEEAEDVAIINESDKAIAVEATETVVSRKRQPSPLKSLIFGTPEPNSKAITVTNLFVNSLLVLMSIDMTYTADKWYPASDLSFARVGYVSPQTAKILVREPDTKNLPVTISYRIEPHESSGIEYPWMTSAPLTRLGGASDFTAPVQLQNLHPSTRYRYKTSTNHTGTFCTAPSKVNSLDRALGHKIRYEKFTFLTSSCIKPRFPYNPFKHPLHMRGFTILRELLAKGLKAEFMLFLGDFIYIDVPKRPEHSERKSLVEGYRERYRQIYASPEWLGVSENLPWIHVIDDHEIANDWDKNTTGLYPYAMDPFFIYQHSVNPPTLRPGATYYTFHYGAASFFLADTRSYRDDKRLLDGPGKSMLGKKQFVEVINWLTRDEQEDGIQWKIFVTSVPFTKNWRFGSEDSWGGYLYERRMLLEEMWKVGGEGRGGVAVLSGDRHEFGATAFPPPENYGYPAVATVHEFSCSPLSQFYLPKRTYKEIDNEDVMIKYVPDGNTKFGAVEIDSTIIGGEQALLKYRLFVEGKEIWDHIITAELGGKVSKVTRKNEKDDKR